MGYSFLCLLARPVDYALMSSSRVPFFSLFLQFIYNSPNLLWNNIGLFFFFVFINELHLVPIRSVMIRPLMRPYKMWSLFRNNLIFFFSSFIDDYLIFSLWKIRRQIPVIAWWWGCGGGIIEEFGWEQQGLQEGNWKSKEVSSHRRK